MSDVVSAALVANGFTSIETLQHCEEQDVVAMGVHPLAQKRVAMAAINLAKKLAAGQSVTMHEQSVKRTPKPTTTARTLQETIPPADNSAGEVLDTLLKSINQPAAAQARKDIDTTIYLQPVQALGKPLEIIDYVNLTTECEIDYEHIVSEIGQGQSLVLKTGSRKLKLENINVWQWSIASIRIQDKLQQSGLLLGDQVRQYMSYSCKILQFNARFDWQSILAYDKQYRLLQAQYGFPWGSEVPHLMTTTLIEKDKNFTKTFQKGGPKQQPKTGFNSNKPKVSQMSCRDFNRGLCTHNPCRFQHVCSMQGCGKDHPACQHDNSKNM